MKIGKKGLKEQGQASGGRRHFSAVFAALTRLVEQGYETSIVRRAMLLCFFILPAFGANLLVHYFGAALLSPESFGVFYVANTLGNVLFSPALIVNTLVTRQLVKAVADASERAAIARWLHLERAMIGLGALGAAGTLIALLLIGHVLGIRSWTIALLVVVDAYAAYIADLGRALLQSLRRTVLLGLYTLGWMVARLTLCVAGIVVFDTAGGALLGSIGSAFVVVVCFHLWFVRGMPARRAALPALRSFLPLLSITLGYGLVIAISNLDVLISFLLLSERDLGTYSASSVFPKAILVVSMPILQLLFALVTAEHAGLVDYRGAAGKSVVVVFGLAAVGAATVWLSAPWSCGGPWGLRLCNASTLTPLLLSVLPLSLLRVLVLLQFARGRDRRVLFLALPVALYLSFAWHAMRSIDVLAKQFAVFSTVCFLVFLAFCVAADARLLRTAGAAGASVSRRFSRRSYVRRR